MAAVLPRLRRLAVVVLCCAAPASCRADPVATTSRSAAGTLVAAPRTSSPVPTVAEPVPARSGPTRPDPARVRKQAEAAVAALAAGQPPGSISVAAENMTTGARFVAGRRSGMWTASAYKLFVLETLMLQQHGPVADYQAGDAQLAIENSDNPAGYRLFLAAGGTSGLEAAARRFGMRHTVLTSYDPTFTRTSAADFLVLARNLVDPDSPLTPAARRYALGLMSRVEADQRWGVGAAADDDTVFYNKNGWLSIDDTNEPGDTDDGRWVVASVGIIRCHHQLVVLAVFTQHQPLKDDGVRLVEQLAKVAAAAVTAR
jgi:beta-lactamase class A